MADKKISALTSATTPLAGTEVLPIVQSGSTVKVSVADLTTGRSVTVANVTASSATTNAGVFADYNGTNVGRMVAATNGNLYIGQQTGSGTVSFGTSANGDLVFLNGTQIGLGTTSTTETVNFGGNAKLNTGNLVVGTAGKGIDFSANGGDILTQYDEGTWTPTVTASSGTLTTVTATGNYTRIGRCVTANFQVTLTNVGTASGALIVSLPFTAGLFPAIGTGREDQNTGVSLQARIQSAVPTVAYVLNYANTSVIATGNVIQCTITYFV